MQDFANRYRKNWLRLLGRKPRPNQDARSYDKTDTSPFGITTADGTHLLLTGPLREGRRSRRQ